MDNDILQHLVSDANHRRFWIKTVGIPWKEPDLQEIFSLPDLTVEFTNQPYAIEIGDMLIVHKIAISKVVYVAECRSAARQVTEEEIKRHSFKEHWSWTMELSNLTPTYGRCWAKYKIKPFTMVKTYNSIHPGEQLSLGSLQYGSGHLQIPFGFAAYLLQKMMDL